MPTLRAPDPEENRKRLKLKIEDGIPKTEDRSRIKQFLENYGVGSSDTINHYSIMHQPLHHASSSSGSPSDSNHYPKPKQT